MTAAYRFFSKVVWNGDADECWEWAAGTAGKGYGQFWNGERQMPAHRWAYEFLVGPVPAGLQLDHLCRNPRCVNPAHLEPVSGHRNILRGESPSAVNSRKQVCKHGHPLKDRNLIVEQEQGHPRRRCRECREDADRRRRARERG